MHTIDDEYLDLLEALAAARWPLADLMRLVRLPQHIVARVMGVSGSTMLKLHVEGLTDRQADTWAMQLGFHPAEVWPEWLELRTLAS